jgi:hypothetical protein
MSSFVYTNLEISEETHFLIAHSRRSLPHEQWVRAIREAEHQPARLSRSFEPESERSRAAMHSE